MVYPHVGKTCAAFAAFVLKVLKKRFISKTITIHQKSAKTAKFFSHLAYVIYGIAIMLVAQQIIF